MNDVMTSRLRRGAIGTIAVVLGAGLLTVPASARQSAGAGAVQLPPAATRLTGFATGQAAVRVGGAVWDTATVLPAGARAVTVQVRRAGAARWSTGSSASTSSGGAVALGLQPPAAGTWQFRAVVAATARATRFVSPARTVTASGRATATRVSGFAASAAAVKLGRTVSDAVVVTPRASRTVLVQARRPGATRFSTQSTGSTSRGGGFRAVYRPTSAGAWHFRIVVPASATARSVTSAVRQVTAVDDSAGGDTTASGTGPTTTTGGTTTGGTTTGGTTTGGTTPGGDTPGGDTPGGPTQPAVTTAALAVRVPGYPNIAPADKLTVDLPFAFDASASVATDGRTLVSGRVDYGDGQTDAFTAPNGPLDYWNTLHAYSSTGTKTVTLTVTDSAGTTDTSTVTVDVFDAPTASLEVTSGTPQVGQPVTLALGATTPAGTQLRSYSLIVRGNESYAVTGDAAPPATADLTFSQSGPHTVTLCVENDADGSPDAVTVTIDVAPAP